ncbi:hypothetical protein [Rhizobium leguminosarum]|uniref:hypothetical protein n=1 Tax=Rhizobium leguminosarum TaxID=384 RepID=UPI001D574E80|nr:hypothetical protein [Rhizobium leguminosarum]MBP2448039.1 hypothetical protein [Rhizobium leguminosarum]
MAEIIPFPNPVSNVPIDIQHLTAADASSGNLEMDKMLQARARIEQVLDELDRLSFELHRQS